VDVLAAEQPGRERDGHVVQFEYLRAGHDHLAPKTVDRWVPRAPTPASSSARWQRTSWCRTRTAWGRSTEHRSTANRHRAANAQPGDGPVRIGGRPGTGSSRSPITTVDGTEAARYVFEAEWVWPLLSEASTGPVEIFMILEESHEIPLADHGFVVWSGAIAAFDVHTQEELWRVPLEVGEDPEGRYYVDTAWFTTPGPYVGLHDSVFVHVRYWLSDGHGHEEFEVLSSALVDIVTLEPR
jgi:hypothetical protein